LLNLALSLASAVLLILVFPRFDAGLLAPVALVPLLVAAAREPRPLRRFLMGEAAGFVYWFSVCYWIQSVLEVHGAMGAALSWLAFLLFCLAKALQTAVFTWLAGFLMTRWYAVPAVAALWTGIERTHAPLGFPWLALGNAGVDMSLPARLAPFIGVYGLSFVFVMLNAAAALVLLRRPRRELAWLGALAALYLLPALPRAQAPASAAVVLQPNVADSNDWSAEKRDALHNRLALRSMESTLAPGAPPPELIVWPEMPAPLYIDRDPALGDRLARLARAARTPVLATVVAHTPTGEPLNSAVLVSARGEVVDRYDKIQLVPFGEFVPSLFGWVNRITGETGDFAPGSRVVVFPSGEHRLGAFICYESAFPHLVRQFARGGAEVLINLSNDGYFGHSAAREQHLKLVRMRAIENRRWIVRSTNDGITAAIDPAGRITQRLEPYQEATARARFAYSRETTFYTRHGDWFAWLCLAVGIAAASGRVTGIRPRRSPASGS
jgi:apolipoprotein N-acyltransferase